MCGICGCGETEQQHSQTQPHAHDEAARLVKVEQELLSKNDAYAQKNRDYFRQQQIFTLNLVSSPGAGKTTLLVATINALKEQLPIAVIEGDQQTDRDAERIRATGVTALQINTGKACHLDAHSIGYAARELALQPGSLLAIENVGNLVCPSAFDLGEAHKVVVLSVTEGDDKPLKYPDMFAAAELMLINKIDLLPYVDFDVERCCRYAKQVNPGIQIMQLSATRQDNFQDWSDWLLQQTHSIKNQDYDLV